MQVNKKNFSHFCLLHLQSNSGSKVPSNQQILRISFYDARIVSRASKETATLKIQEVLLFLQSARISERKLNHKFQ